MEEDLAISATDAIYGLMERVLAAGRSGSVSRARALNLMRNIAGCGRDLNALLSNDMPQGDGEYLADAMGYNPGRRQGGAAGQVTQVLEHSAIQDQVAAAKLSALTSVVRTPGISEDAKAAARREIDQFFAARGQPISDAEVAPVEPTTAWERASYADAAPRTIATDPFADAFPPEPAPGVPQPRRRVVDQDEDIPF